MSYFCYFTLIIIIFHSFVCNIFLTCLTYSCSLYVCTCNFCFLTFIFNFFFLFLRPIHHLNLQTNQSLSSLYNNLGPCHFDNRFQRPWFHCRYFYICLWQFLYKESKCVCVLTWFFLRLNYICCNTFC